MNRIRNYILAGLALFTMFSCSENAMDKINKDKNHPTNIQSYLSIPDLCIATAFRVVGGDFNFYASSYIEHNVGTYGQLYNAEIRVSEPYASSTYNNSWNAAYSNLWNLRDVIEKTSEGGTEAGNNRTLAVAQILSAINLAALTDAMGDIPWSESGKPGVVFQPKLDSQKDVYTSIFAFLDNAIANLDLVKEGDVNTLSSHDFIYKGNVALWKKAAYALKARYTLRLSLKQANYQNVLDFAAKSFAATAEQCVVKYNGGTTNNPNYMFFTDRDYFGSSSSLRDKLNDRNDPRFAAYFTPYPQTTGLVFAPNGSPSQVQKSYSISKLLKATNPTYLISYHELLFIQAEAAARLGKTTDALAFLSKAVDVAFVKVGLTSAAASAYLASIQGRLQTDLLAEIMVQKYLAFYDDESLEAYNDYRRLKAMGNNFITLANTKPFPLRYTYGNSDVLTNKAVAVAYADGQYVKTENVWWAGGTR